jgi:hypothetical protein
MSTEIPTNYLTILFPSDMEKLKKVTGESTIKEALRKAVEFTLANMQELKET